MDRPDVVLQGVVAVDGPSGTGKSTTARGLAVRLGARYLDTGAMYRAATLAVMRADVPLDASSTDADGHDDAVGVAVHADLVMSTDPTEPRVRLDGDDVAAEIRGTDVTRQRLGDLGDGRGAPAPGRRAAARSSPRPRPTASASSSRAATSGPSWSPTPT